MKIAVLSDIHGNWAALTAVLHDIEQWQPDVVVVNGDVMNGSPYGRRCWERIDQQQPGWHWLQGNHEGYVLNWRTKADPFVPWQQQLHSLSYHSFITFSRQQLDQMAALPTEFSWTAPDGSRLVVMHASVRGNRDGLYADAPWSELKQQIMDKTAVFVTGHTHQPFIRWVDETAVVNCGGVGLTGDGNRQAVYGRFIWSAQRGWQSQLVRLPYDFAQAEQAFFDTGYLEEVGLMAALSLVEVRSGRNVKGEWRKRYQTAVTSGQIDFYQSASHLLDTLGFWPYVDTPLHPYIIGDNTRRNAPVNGQ